MFESPPCYNLGTQGYFVIIGEGVAVVFDGATAKQSLQS